MRREKYPLGVCFLILEATLHDETARTSISAIAYLDRLWLNQDPMDLESSESCKRLPEAHQAS
jgi:hypothetical protein